MQFIQGIAVRHPDPGIL